MFQFFISPAADDGTRNINVSDTITVSESVTRLLIQFVNISDSVTVSESVAVTKVLNANVADTVTVSDTASLTKVFNVGVTDVVTLRGQVKMFRNRTGADFLTGGEVFVDIALSGKLRVD